MRIKITCLLLVLIGCVAAVFFQLDWGAPTFTSKNCPFCNPSVLDAQKFYEEDQVLALCTYKPVMPGHVLVIPKRHVERFEMLSDAEITQIGQVIKKVNFGVEKAYGTSSYLLLQKNGREVGQTVPHVHFHYIPRKTGDDSILKFMFKMLIENMRRPISVDERAEAVEKMKAAME